MGVCITIYRVGQKTRLFLTVDNFAAVSAEVCDMSKVSKFFPEKCKNLDVSEIKYSLHSLHKYSMHLKLFQI